MLIDDDSLRAGFLKQVISRPDAPALVVKGRVFSFGELDETARRWAGAIVRRLGGPATRVGIFGSRSAVSYTAVLAALYSGAAFVPLNPRFPADRTRAMISQAQLDAIFVDKLASQQLSHVLRWARKAATDLVARKWERSRFDLGPAARRGSPCTSAGRCGVSVVYFRHNRHPKGCADSALQRSRIYQLGSRPLSDSNCGPLLADV